MMPNNQDRKYADIFEYTVQEKVKKIIKKLKLKRIILGWLFISTPFIVALAYLRYDLIEIIGVGLGTGALITIGVLILRGS